jgi:hypothetical protein
VSERKSENYACVQAAKALKLEAELTHISTLETITTLTDRIKELEKERKELILQKAKLDCDNEFRREYIEQIAADKGNFPNKHYPVKTTIALAKKYLALQAKLDQVMLEYCPDEMTAEQLEDWGKNQRAVKEK